MKKELIKKIINLLDKTSEEYLRYVCILLETFNDEG